MNLNHAPTIDQLSDLFRSTNDAAGNHCLWVDDGGEVHLDLIPAQLTPISFQASQPTMAIRFETLTRGQGDVGRKAAQDAAYIQGKFNDLVRIWPLSTPGKVIVTDGSEY